MKRLMLMAALCAASLGCLSDQASGPFRLLNAYATSGSTCDPEFSRVLSQGRLVWNVSNNYGLFLNLETDNSRRAIDINGEELASGLGYSDITLEEITYEYAGADLGVKEESSVLRVLFRPGVNADQNSYISVLALGPKAVEGMQAALDDSENGQVNLMVTIRLRGHMGSGGFAVESNAFTFPLQVLASAACSGGASPTYACPGQDPVCGG